MRNRRRGARGVMLAVLGGSAVLAAPAAALDEVNTKRFAHRGDLAIR